MAIIDYARSAMNKNASETCGSLQIFCHAFCTLSEYKKGLCTEEHPIVINGLSIAYLMEAPSKKKFREKAP